MSEILAKAALYEHTTRKRECIICLMPNFAHPAGQRCQTTFTGAACVLTSLAAMNVGAAFAKHLFPVIGVYGVTAVRILLAAVVLLILHRPWRRALPTSVLPGLVGYGAALGLMNLLIYQAFARLPIGIATGIEVLGPLAVVLLQSQSARDFIWFMLAAVGLALLLPLRTDQALDHFGLIFAATASLCWALYIIYGKRISGTLGRDAVAWGMVVATIVTAPVGLAYAGAALFNPGTLALGLGVAVLSSVLPYSLEMEAMSRLPTHLFGILLSGAPAVAALTGFLVLGEVISWRQSAGIFCIVIASAGGAWSAMARGPVEVGEAVS